MTAPRLAGPPAGPRAGDPAGGGADLPAGRSARRPGEDVAGRRGRRAGGPVLTDRELGRATLCRQLLLERAELPVVAAVEHLVGLNAQDPNPPYLALWSRLAPFALADLTAAIEDRALVRSTTLRATQHLMSVADFRLVRPLLGPLLRRVARNAFGRRTGGVDPEAIAAAARDLLAGGRVLTRPELGRLLAARLPGADPAALAWTAQYLLPLVHPAPAGTWNSHGPLPLALADWTGVHDGQAGGAELRTLVRRYLAAFGPATAADMRTWSGIGGLRQVFEQMRGELAVFTDARGRRLFDLPDAPRPPADTPAPVRLLPPFDAVLLAHADRARVMADQVRRQVCVGAAVAATVLVDGTVAATWTVTHTPARPPSRRAPTRPPSGTPPRPPAASADACSPGGSARSPEQDEGEGVVTLTVRPLRPLSAAERAAVEAEAEALLAFTHPHAGARRVRITPSP